MVVVQPLAEIRPPPLPEMPQVAQPFYETGESIQDRLARTSSIGAILFGVSGDGYGWFINAPATYDSGKLTAHITGQTSGA
jgi:hypothetical protein